MSHSITYLDWTLIFGWYVVWCGTNNLYQKDICLREFGLCIENMVINLGSIINVNWGGYTTT